MEPLDPRGPCDRYGTRDVRDGTVDARRTELQAAECEAVGRSARTPGSQVRGGTCPDGPAAGAGRYDAGREAARLSLLEQRSRLAHELAELAGLENGTRFPAMAEPMRAAQIAEARVAVAELRTDIDRLSEQAGDEEDIVDEAGRLPQDRRELMLAIFSARRSVKVPEVA